MADQAVMIEMIAKAVAEVTRIVIQTMAEMQTKDQKVHKDTS